MSRTGTRRIASLLTAALLLLAGLWLAGKAAGVFYRQAYPCRYSEIFEREAERAEIPLSLAYAVARTESSFRPGATSSVGARGIMQITEETFDWIKFRIEPQADTTFEEMYDPEQGIRYGCSLLGLLMEEFGSPVNTLCAYHAGWGVTKSWLRDETLSSGGEILEIPYPDTEAYVNKVLRTAEIYQKLYGPDQPL